MFDKTPKVRPPLSDKMQAIYVEHYKSNREGSSAASSLAQWMESWLHKRVADDVRKGCSSTIRTLELGAGTLNQLQYEPAVGPYDIIEPFVDLYKNSPELDRIDNVYADIEEIGPDTQYDRITSVAVLEHVCNLPDVVARCALLLADGGAMRSSIPSEGTWLWTLGWMMTTGLEFRLRYGLNYGELIAHEHINTADEIEEILEYFFTRNRCRCLGLSRRHSFYRYYESSGPDKTRCRDWLGL
jgi:hypothetical protein